MFQACYRYTPYVEAYGGGPCHWQTNVCITSLGSLLTQGANRDCANSYQAIVPPQRSRRTDCWHPPTSQILRNLAATPLPQSDILPLLLIHTNRKKAGHFLSI